MKRYILPPVIESLAGNLPEGATAYLVGGACRDEEMRFQHYPIPDYDIEVFGMEEHALVDYLSTLGEVREVGKAFGVYKLKLGDEIDVALPRTEVLDGESHTDFTVTVDPTLSIEQAAQRRDFTINALYYNIKEGVLYDPTKQGLRDLEDKKLRPVSEKFKEDPLRVLRGFQFAARFDLTATDEFLEYSRELAPKLATVSGERIWMEFSKWLASKKPSAGCKAIAPEVWEWVAKPLKFVMADVDDATLDAAYGFNKLGNLCKDDAAAVVMAILLQPIKLQPQLIESVLVDICMPLKVKAQVHALLRLEFSEFLALSHTKGYWRNMQLNLYPATFGQMQIMFKCVTAKVLSIHKNLHKFLAGDTETLRNCDFCQGRDLEALGVPAGEKMGKLIEVVNKFYLSGQLNHKSDIIGFLATIPMYSMMKADQKTLGC